MISSRWLYLSLVIGLIATFIISWFWTGYDLNGISKALLWVSGIQIFVGFSFAKPEYKLRYHSNNKAPYIDRTAELNDSGRNIEAHLPVNQQASIRRRKEGLGVIASGILLFFVFLAIDLLF